MPTFMKVKERLTLGLFVFDGELACLSTLLLALYGGTRYLGTN